MMSYNIKVLAVLYNYGKPMGSSALYALYSNGHIVVGEENTMNSLIVSRSLRRALIILKHLYNLKFCNIAVKILL